MFRHNFLLAFRSFKKHKGAFLINLIGLSTGLACVLLIFLWVRDELRVDKFHENDNELYQVMNNLESSKGIQTLDDTPVPLADALLKEMPEVEHTVAVNDSWEREGVVSAGEVHLQAKGEYAGKDFFNVFSYELILGDKNNVLADKNSIVLSEQLAKKLFHTTDNVVGKTIKWKHPLFESVFQVSGIFKSPPANSTAQFDFVSSIGVLLDNDQWAKRWTNDYAKTYLVLKKGTDPKQFNGKIAGLLKSKDPLNDKLTLFIQQYSAKYLHGQYENGRPAGGRIVYVRLFSIIAVFILLIACVNFMNLSTAKASLKMKEIGVKKTLGATRQALIARFLGESLLTTFLSLLVAIPLVILLLPRFNEITGKHLYLGLGPTDILAIAAIVLVTGLFSGSYPAFYLSGFQPLAVLKGRFSTSVETLWVRKGLVVFQFTLSVIFIVGLLVVNEQIKYTQTKNLGYNRDNILSFEWKGELYDKWNGLLEGKSNEKFETFIQELKNVPGVVNATNMSGNILDKIYGQSGISWRGVESDKNYVFQSPPVGYNFMETLGITLAEGRSFSRDHHDDYSKIMVNEAAVKLMGLKNPVGQTIDMNGQSQIIGVVKDFQYGSLRNTVEPMIFRLNPGRNIMIKIKAGSEQATIEQLKKFYHTFLPEYTFDFSFMDSDYQSLYVSENRVALLSKYFTAIAIIISCLGLYGFAAFTAERRQKEIGIRKVLGASVGSVIAMLSRDFVYLVLIAMTIASPIAWYMLKGWLQNFASRVDLSWWIFALAGLSAVAIALVAIGFHTVKAAIANPVDSLKSE